MTTIVMFRKNSRYIGFSAHGHAEYGPYGSDIVCSAVSALMQGTIIGLDVAGVRVRVAGRLKVTLSRRLMREQMAAAELLMETLCRSLCSIEAKFPDNLNVIIRDKYTKGGNNRV